MIFSRIFIGELAGARDYKLYYNDCELLSVFYVQIEFNQMQNKILDPMLVFVWSLLRINSLVKIYYWLKIEYILKLQDNFLK